MKLIRLVSIVALVCFISCSKHEFSEGVITCKSDGDSIESIGRGALLASRIATLKELKSIIKIEYIVDTDTAVHLRHCADEGAVHSVLKSGISQTDIIKARDGEFSDQLRLILGSPYSIRNRLELGNIYLLARRRNGLFGWGDVAFYDLAEIAEEKIITKELAYMTPRDSSEKGYINTFNHVTAQAIITSCFSEKMADFIADVHELYNMRELTSGNFTEDQLNDPEMNPVDNYVDMINNEWGQEIGKQLRKKYRISRKTIWTPQLLANYLNDLQSYYSWVFQIGMDPFKAEEEVVVRFSKKINTVLGEIIH